MDIEKFKDKFSDIEWKYITTLEITRKEQIQLYSLEIFYYIIGLMSFCAGIIFDEIMFYVISIFLIFMFFAITISSEIKLRQFAIMYQINQNIKEK